MTQAQLSQTLAEEINASYGQTMELVKQTRKNAQRAIQEAIKCGSLLEKAKTDFGRHGYWQNWLKQNCPLISYETAQRWIRLANLSHVTDLNNAAGLRQAYIMAGIIDEGEAHMNQSERSQANIIDRLATPIGKVREWFSVRMQRVPIEQWSREERDATKAQLQPLVELYQRL